MAAVLGRNFLLKIYDGVSAYNTVDGQQEGTLSIEGVDADVQTKDDAGAPHRLPAGYDWTFEASGIVETEADTALIDARDALLGKATVSCRFTSPGGETFTGSCTVKSLEYSGSDAEGFAWSLSLTGAGALTPA